MLRIFGRLMTRLQRGNGDTRVSLTRQATGRDTIVIGFVGEKDMNNLPSHRLCFEEDARIGRG